MVFSEELSILESDLHIDVVVSKKKLPTMVSMCIMNVLANTGSGEPVITAGGVQLRSAPYTARPVAVTVDDDLESVWTWKMNGGDGVVTSSSDIDDNSSTVSSSVADISSEYAHRYNKQNKHFKS